MADVDRCVCCGEIVPEGRMVCPQCEIELQSKPDIGTTLDIEEKTDENLITENYWTNFCMAYPVEFYEELCGFRLTLIQKIILHIIGVCNRIKIRRNLK